MRVTRTKYPGWNQHPVYHVPTHECYIGIRKWMGTNNVEHFLLSSGSNGYTFQVKSNHAWFILRCHEDAADTLMEHFGVEE